MIPHQCVIAPANIAFIGRRQIVSCHQCGLVGRYETREEAVEARRVHEGGRAA